MKLSDRTYCRKCHSQVTRDAHTSHAYGWCQQCSDVVGYSHCKVSYWAIATSLMLPWIMPATASLVS